MKALATLAAAATVALATVPATGSASSTATPTAAKKCRGDNARWGRINGKRVCLNTGSFCARKNESQYRKYGYSCSIKKKGRWRLGNRR